MSVSAAGFLALALGAVMVGFSKTAISGASTLAIVVFATVLPTRESTGALLVLLMVGDILAVWTYRGHAEWALIRRLIAPVLAGVVVGAFFLALAPVGWLKPVIGGIVVVMSLIQVWRMWTAGRAADPRAAAADRAGNRVAHAGHAGAGTFFGSLAGFTTMVANAGGPVMTLYLLRSRLEVTRFVGTMAWFFACVNVTKLPISIGLGLVRPQRLLLCLALVPAVIVGAVMGRLLISRISRTLFEKVVLAVAGLSGLYLMLS